MARDTARCWPKPSRRIRHDWRSTRQSIYKVGKAAVAAGIARLARYPTRAISTTLSATHSA